MDTLNTPNTVNNHSQDFPRIMGIINTTPDSFFSKSRRESLEAGLAAALAMEEAGADILDIGGESTRPGSDYVEEDEELARVIPLIAEIRKHSRIPISVDTRKYPVGLAALDAGADMINDISALEDPELGRLAAGRDVPVILMHKRGNPKEMQKDPYYENAVEEISRELMEAVDRARGLGVPDSRIILDPGIGFAKRLEDNLAVIRGIPAFKALGFPVLIGASRKGFIGKILDLPVEERMLGSVIVHYHAALLGADILRVHDVPETRQALEILRAIRRPGGIAGR